MSDLAVIKSNFNTKTEPEEIYGMPNPDYFNNIYTRLTKDKELNIGYMGGSITDGTVGGTEAVCWRNQVTQWFSTNFQDTKVNAKQASLGGTDTYLASYRVNNAMLEAMTPDRVFIEYATNDYHAGNNFRSSARQLESIILKLSNANPNVDIVVIYSFKDFGEGNPYVTQSVRGMQSIADYYGIVDLPLGYDAYELYKDTWYLKESNSNVIEHSFTYDNIHLTEFGHNYYKKRICALIGDEILSLVPDRVLDTELKPHTMPEKFHSNTLENS